MRIWQRKKRIKYLGLTGKNNPNTQTHDHVNHPAHYTSHPSGIECIDITRHYDFAIGCAIKYLWRAGLKAENTEIEDLKKAIFYINDKIKQIENGSK
jgi:hypothetical protein